MKHCLNKIRLLANIDTDQLDQLHTLHPINLQTILALNIQLGFIAQDSVKTVFNY